MSGTARPNDQIPRRNAQRFVCPHCNTLAKQDWFPLFYIPEANAKHQELNTHAGQAGVSRCHYCTKMAMWLGIQMVFPQGSTAPLPVADMPEDVKALYMEARNVFDLSARGAGGLLRLAFTKLFPHLGVNKDDPNRAIAELVKVGLAPDIQQQALDLMRVLSNQTVHEGFVSEGDQPATVLFLFWLLNYIVEQMISKRKQIQTAYASLPQDKREAIAKRDAVK
ncbi:MAG: DUF4145 domain-containing protein [Planctomycetia bacterium]|nr:DUF4145 domain-containing protein [Planctomycetia bacterium]